MEKRNFVERDNCVKPELPGFMGMRPDMLASGLELESVK